MNYRPDKCPNCGNVNLIWYESGSIDGPVISMGETCHNCGYYSKNGEVINSGWKTWRICTCSMCQPGKGGAND